MIPRGYLTIPEALEIIRARIDDDDQLMQQTPKPDRGLVACQSLAKAIVGHSVTVCTMSGGVVTPVEDKWNDFENTTTKGLLNGWESWLSTGRVSNNCKYNGCKLFIKPYALEFWLGPTAEVVPPPRTGAPGRPSNMQVVLAEHARRARDGATESSRAAEARALATWFKEEHSTLQCPGPGTIKNALPKSFRPRTK